MWRRRLRSVGLVLVVLGAAVLVGPTLGFDAIETDRSVNAGTVPNPSAQLGLQSGFNGNQIQYQDLGFWQQVANATVGNVTNRVGNPVTVSVSVESIEWSGGSDAVLEVVNDDEFASQMAVNETRDVVLGCSREIGGNSPHATVELAVDGTGDPVSVEDVTMTVHNVSFNCGGAGSGDGDAPEDPIPINDSRIDLQVVGQPTAQFSGGWFGGEYSIVTYDLENTGTDPVTVTGIHVADSNAGSQVNWGEDDELSITASTNGNLDATDGISIGSNAPQYDLDQNATIAGSQTAGVELGQFRSGSYSWQQVDMRGQSVTVVLVVEGLDVQGRSDPVPVEMQLIVA